MVCSEQELVSKKSGFVNCSNWLVKTVASKLLREKNHLLTALLLLFDLFAALLLMRWSMNEWKSKSAMRLLLFYYPFTLLSVFLGEENKLYWNNFSFMYKIIIRNLLIKYSNDFMVSWTWRNITSYFCPTKVKRHNSRFFQSWFFGTTGIFGFHFITSPNKIKNTYVTVNWKKDASKKRTILLSQMDVTHKY